MSNRRSHSIVLELPQSELELIEIMENIDFLVADRERAGFHPALLDVLRSLRQAVEAEVWRSTDAAAPASKRL